MFLPSMFGLLFVVGPPVVAACLPALDTAKYADYILMSIF